MCECPTSSDTGLLVPQVLAAKQAVADKARAALSMADKRLKQLKKQNL